MRRVPLTADTILDLIEAHLLEHGYPPSIRFLAKATRTPQTTVYARLRDLEADGHISRVPGRARAITINRKNPE